MHCTVFNSQTNYFRVTLWINMLSLDNYYKALQVKT